MNTVEKLSREIARVARLGALYEQLAFFPNTNTRPAVAVINATLEAAHVAIGDGDALTIIAAIKALEEFQE